ncbi:MAG: hypothetical protein K2J24_05810, partial [Muribaculaceae bacterium]|nr:hypothetical protein [Muribaculaceae bacterium]
STFHSSHASHSPTFLSAYQFPVLSLLSFPYFFHIPPFYHFYSSPFPLSFPTLSVIVFYAFYKRVEFSEPLVLSNYHSPQKEKTPILLHFTVKITNFAPLYSAMAP